MKIKSKMNANQENNYIKTVEFFLMNKL